MTFHFTLRFLSKSQEAGTALYLLRQQSSDPFEGRSNGEVLGTAGKNCRCRRDFMGRIFGKTWPQILGSCCYHSPNSFRYRGSCTSSIGVRIRRFCGFVFFFGRLSGRGVVCCVITWESVGQPGQLDRFFCQSKAFLATRSQSFQQNHS